MTATAMKAVKGNGSFPPSKFGVTLTAYDGIDILQILDGIKKSNTTLHGSLMKRIVKNEKFITNIIKEHQAKEDVIIDQFCEKHTDGRVLWWDGNLEEVKNEKGEIVAGELAVFDSETRFLIGINSGKPKAPRAYGHYVKDEEKRKEYFEANQKLADETYVADVYKFTDKELDNINIPTQNVKPETFYNKLVLEEVEN